MANLNEAMNHYNGGDYAKSYEILKEYAFNNNINDETAFIYARSAYEIGIYDEAEVVYLELLKRDPSNPRIKLELARLYSQQPKQHFKANTLYQEVLNSKNVPDSVRAKVKTALSSLNVKEQNHFFTAFFGFGVGHDTNAHNATNAKTAEFEVKPGSNIPFLRPGIYELQIPNNVDTDKFIEYFMSLNHSYKANENVSIDTKALVYSQKFNDADTENLDIASIETGVSYATDESKTALSASYTRLIQDDKSNLNLYTITPSFEYILSQNLLYKTKLKFSKKNFLQEFERYKDSKIVEAQNSLSLATENFGLNTLTFGFGVEAADGEKKVDVDNNFMNFKLENVYPINQHTTFLTGLEYYYTSYKLAIEDSPLLQLQNRRKDKKYAFDLTLVEAINKSLSLALNYRYTDNNSNHDVRSYKKQVVKTNVYYAF